MLYPKTAWHLEIKMLTYSDNIQIISSEQFHKETIDYKI